MTVCALVEYFAQQAAKFYADNLTTTLRGQHQLVCIEQAVEAVLRDAFKQGDLKGLQLAHSQLSWTHETPLEVRYWRTAFQKFVTIPSDDLANSYLRQLGAAIASCIRNSFSQLVEEDKVRRSRSNELLYAPTSSSSPATSGSPRREPRSSG